MNKPDVKALLGGFLSKKWIVTLLCLLAGSVKMYYFEPLTEWDIAFLLGITGIYSGANVADKNSVLKHTK